MIRNAKKGSVMQVKLIEGLHLTATSKRHIVELLSQNIMKGGTKRIHYTIEKIEGEENQYSVVTSQVESNDYGKKSVRKYKYVVEVK